MQVDAKKIIVEGDVNVLVDTAKKVGESVARQLTTSQIRNVFGEVRRIGMNWNQDESGAYRQVVLLKPKLAYQAKRERGFGVAELQSVLEPCIDQIRDAPVAQRKVYFDRFTDFFEAILAYHKAAGGN